MNFEVGDWRGIWPKSVKKNWLEDQVKMAEYIKTAIKDEKITLPQAALKYILMNNNITSVIPGSANSKHVRLNTDSQNGKKLSKKTINTTKQLWIEGKIHGTYNGSI